MRYVRPSSHSKKPVTPYHLRLQLSRPPGSPSQTRRFTSSGRRAYGTFSGRPARFRKRSRSSWHSLPKLVWNGLTAPPASVRRGSGITRSWSIAIVRPKPLQVSQAPTGWLNENSAGDGSPYAMSQVAQWSEALKRRGRSSPSTCTATRPSP